MDNMRDIIRLSLEDADTQGDDFSEFVGIHKIVV